MGWRLEWATALGAEEVPVDGLSRRCEQGVGDDRHAQGDNNNQDCKCHCQTPADALTRNKLAPQGPAMRLAVRLQRVEFTLLFPK